MATKTKKNMAAANRLAETLLGDPPDPSDFVRPISRPAINLSAHFEMLAINQIEILDNVRKTFDEAALQELAESIREHGILQPIVVREFILEGRYQLVAGERRVRAAQRAGLSQVPCMVRHLTDKQFYEVQILENLQRRDVHPLEEAEGFRKLLEHGFSEEEIADKLGKPRHFIAQRLRLNNLLPIWTEHLNKGEITLGGALILARLEAHHQETVKKQVYGNPIATEMIRRVMQQHVYLDLHGTPFPKYDTELFPSAGACLTCTKRTGYLKSLFPEIDKNDYCLDSVCYQTKQARFVARQAEKLEEEGKDFLKISPNYNSSRKDVMTAGDYRIVPEAEADQSCHRALLVDGQEAGKEVFIKPYRLSKDLATPELREKQAQERAKTIRDNKIKAKVKQLTAEALYLSLKRPEGIRAVLVYFLVKKIGYGTVSKDTKGFLVKEYGFSEYPESAEYDVKHKWFSDNLVRLEIAELTELYFHYDLRRSAAGEYDSTISDLSSSISPVIMKAIQSKAEELVDKTKGKKQKEAVE